MNSNKPIVYLDFYKDDIYIGRIYVELFPDSFPDGVENFIRLIEGSTFREKQNGYGEFKYITSLQRTYAGCKVIRQMYDNYIVLGDIYENNGSSAGTIFNDNPIEPNFGDYFYPHETKGLISLVPFIDTATNKKYYDSIFMITLNDIQPNNVMKNLDIDQIVIGSVSRGIEVVDKINKLLKPIADKKRTNIYIKKCGLWSPLYRSKPMHNRLNQ